MFTFSYNVQNAFVKSAFVLFVLGCTLYENVSGCPTKYFQTKILYTSVTFDHSTVFDLGDIMYMKIIRLSPSENTLNHLQLNMAASKDGSTWSSTIVSHAINLVVYFFLNTNYQLF
ncbi:uncharacterized protein LOC130647842 [Hydractinia symbiolongicarpus]|uniref:uncharacterized protein LOC130647842 n=1 Tax=Hydractinia symbiolongicarpus TaxID=13093 RepID=UPI00254A20E2|nr:uncharacterized protein LOC130647842 [Hydractinia symbiolongicarpus]